MKPFDWIPAALHGRALDAQGYNAPITTEVVVIINPTPCVNCGVLTERGLVWCRGVQMIDAIWVQGQRTDAICVGGRGVRAVCGDCETKAPAKPENRFQHLDIDWDEK